MRLMRLRACPYTPQIRQAVARGHWPPSNAPELAAHAQQCRACSDLATVTGAFLAARAEAARSVRLPAPGLIWWKAQLRRRNQAIERIQRPIAGAQIFALAAILAVGAVGLFAKARSSNSPVQSGVGPEVSLREWIATASQSTIFHAGASWSGTGIIYLLTCIALLGGVVLYLASDRP